MFRLAVLSTVVVAVSGLMSATAGASGSSVGLLGTTQITVVQSPRGVSFGGTNEFDRTNIRSIMGTATTSEVQIDLTGGVHLTNFGINLTAPHGTTFHRGTYFGDDVYGVRGSATLYEGLGCQGAQFTILDVASTGSTLTRLDADFQTVCGTGVSNVDATVFGELQLGETIPATSVLNDTRSFRWPDVPVHTRSPALLPIHITNNSSAPAAVGLANRSGQDRTEFPLIFDHCSNQLLAPHHACTVGVAFAPAAAGTRTATITIPVGTRQIRTDVAGIGTPGVTSLRLNSQPGDFIGAGKRYVITDAQEQMDVATIGPDEFFGGVHNADISQWWAVKMGPISGPITLGTRPTTINGSSTTWGLDIDGDGRACSTTTGYVTIKQAVFNADHAPVAFDATFSQTCDGDTGGLTGEIKYHAAS